LVGLRVHTDEVAARMLALACSPTFTAISPSPRRKATGAGGAEHPCSAPTADGGDEIGDALPGSPRVALDPIESFDHLELLLPAALPAAPERHDPVGPVEARYARE
jgi:hypothetical protein